eukprot:gene34494-46282_t
MATNGTSGVSAAAARVGRYRWVICGLLFAATAINYVDRQMIGLLKPLLSQDLHWSENDYATIVFWFQTAYAIGYLGFGKVVDLIGARFGYAIAVVIWTIAHVAHGGVYSVTQFAMARFGLGIGESGNFPGGVKAVTSWFPARERAFAIGIFNAGSNVGAIAAPLLVWLLVPLIGWRGTFVATGIFGVAWVIAWLVFFRDDPRQHRAVSAAEVDFSELAERFGVRVGYEALAWGRHVNDYRDAWEIVRRADHKSIGVILDSFHALAPAFPVAAIASIPADKIFLVQLADAPKLGLDVLPWSRHFRCFPGQGDLPVTGFMEAVMATGYSGPWSLEIFNDQFRAGSAARTATDGLRSLILLKDQLAEPNARLA